MAGPLRIGTENGPATKAGMHRRARTVIPSAGRRRAVRHVRLFLWAVLLFPAARPAADKPSTHGNGAKQQARAVMGKAGTPGEGFAQTIGARFPDVPDNPVTAGRRRTRWTWARNHRIRQRDW